MFKDVPISDNVPAVPLMCMVPREPIACVDGEWHEVPQVQRNRKVINRAYEDLKRHVGRSCKE